MSEIEKDGAAPYRLPTGGRIDRGTTLRFTFGGRTLTGHPGDTLASALLAHGVHQTGTSIKLGRPRGIAAAWAEDPNSLVQVEEPFPEPMLLATTIELTDGLAAHGIPGQGRLADVPDSARYDARHVHADLLVVGAGPTGLTAALTAARAGARVVLVDEQSEAGGSLLGTDRPHRRLAGAGVGRSGPPPSWRATPDVVHLQRTTAFGHFDDGFVLALERRTDHLGAAAPRHLSRQRVWRIRARRVLVAAGAHERPVVFTDNDRPGIMLAGGGPHLPAPLRRAGRPHGRRVHHRRQRLRRSDRPRRRRVPRCAPSSTRGRSRRRVAWRSARAVASRSAPGRSSPAPTASSG